MNPTSYLFGSRLACAQTAIFSAKPHSKNAGETSIVFWITAHEKRIPTSCNPNQMEQHFGGFFHASPSASRKTGFYANRDLNRQEVRFIFA
jgi:hypothetical protein